MADQKNDTTGAAGGKNERTLPASKTPIGAVRETEIEYRRTPPPRTSEKGIHPRRGVPTLPDEDSD